LETDVERVYYICDKGVLFDISKNVDVDDYKTTYFLYVMDITVLENKRIHKKKATKQIKKHRS
jgi:hypothetical protein